MNSIDEMRANGCIAKYSPVEMLAGLLAEMTERALNAERELGEVKKSEDTWYQSYLSIKHENATLRNDIAREKAFTADAQVRLEEEKAAHEETKANLEKATQHLNYYIEGGANDDSE